MTRFTHLLPALVGVALSTFALTGCSALASGLQRETSTEFTSATDLAQNWTKAAPWVPGDATQIKTYESIAGNPAVLSAKSETTLDLSLCTETTRQSAPTFEQAWSPADVYVDSVFACGDWAVIPVADGWYGWTPSDPDEKAATPAP